jgi:hypothetical protein
MCRWLSRQFNTACCQLQTEGTVECREEQRCVAERTVEKEGADATTRAKKLSRGAIDV